MMPPAASTYEGRGSQEMFCKLHPDHQFCQTGLYGHFLDRSADLAFLTLFSVVLVGHTVAWITMVRRRSHVTNGFFFAMCLGLVCEIMGYAARLWSASDQFAFSPFFMQVCCLTMGPAFMAAALYLCMRRIVLCFPQVKSFIPARCYTRIFISCDIVSLALQAAGGAMIAAAFKRLEPMEGGKRIMIIGLAFQAFTMFVFIGFSLVFGRRMRVSFQQGANNGAERPGASVQPDPEIFTYGGVAGQRPIILALEPKACKVFIGALAVSTMCIFARCVYRVVELQDGWHGPLARKRVLFILLESALVLVASVAMAALYPAWTFYNEGALNGEVQNNPRCPLDPVRLFTRLGQWFFNKCRPGAGASRSFYQNENSGIGLQNMRK